MDARRVAQATTWRLIRLPIGILLFGFAVVAHGIQTVPWLIAALFALVMIFVVGVSFSLISRRLLARFSDEFLHRLISTGISVDSRPNFRDTGAFSRWYDAAGLTLVQIKTVSH
jgi:hypothetical protein